MTMMTIDREKIVYRPVRDDDRDFLYRLYASTRADEMNMVPWTNEEKEAFVRMQFAAQTQHYNDYYDPKQFFVIETEGTPIGRIYFDRQPADITIIDITLLPELRGAGLGTKLLQEVLDDAARDGIAVLIHVEHFNPAMHLYQRLGFRHIDTNGVYHLMKWEAAK